MKFGSTGIQLGWVNEDQMQRARFGALSLMWVGVISLLPEMFEGFQRYGVARRALSDLGQEATPSLDCHFFNPRSYTTRNNGQVDDKPYGGGPGMVMQAEPLEAALNDARRLSPDGAGTQLIVPTPQGKPLTQDLIRTLAEQSALIFLCGRYEGIDERVLASGGEVTEVSLGDFVLTGGELPTQVMLDAISRWLPGTLGNAESAAADSFADGLLEAPAYTRPERLADGREVPDVLLGGNHAQIARYRRKQALKRTLARRPELLLQVRLTAEDRALLMELFAEQGENNT